MPIYYTRKEKRQLAEERGILVDPIDEWLLEEYTWHLKWDGYNNYAATSLGRNEYGRTIIVFLHHCIMGQPIWEDDEIDHINRNTMDNHRSNMRYATRSQNRINTSRAESSLGARNIYQIEDGRYRVRVRRNGQEYYLGTFGTLDEAVAERDEWLANNGG